MIRNFLFLSVLFSFEVFQKIINYSGLGSLYDRNNLEKVLYTCVFDVIEYRTYII